MSVEFDRGSPGKFDSRTLSRETLGRWTGRILGTGWQRDVSFGGWRGCGVGVLNTNITINKNDNHTTNNIHS